MHLIEDKEVKAKKEHRCNFCDMPIKKGETYYYQKYLDNKKSYPRVYNVWKSHLRCGEIALVLDMYDHYNDEVTKDDFWNDIQIAYHAIFDELPIDSNELEDIEKLDKVCDHFLGEED